MFFQLINLEYNENGSSFSEVLDNENLKVPFIMIPIDTIIYAILTLYFDKVIPGFLV